MVKQLYDMKEVNNEIKKYGVQRTISLTLNETGIQEWKDKGYFKHIRKELLMISNIQFACVKLESGYCTYHFICETYEIANRLKRMIQAMYNNKGVNHLMKCNNTEMNLPTRAINLGEVRACPLFS